MYDVRNCRIDRHFSNGHQESRDLKIENDSGCAIVVGDKRHRYTGEQATTGTMELSLSDARIIAGSQVSGTVCFASPLVQYDASMKIKIVLTGWETSIVSMPEDPERDETTDIKYLTRKCSESHLFFSKGVEVPMDEVTARRRVPVPFEFELPEDLSGSMRFLSTDSKENRVLPSQCDIKYLIIAEVPSTDNCVKKEVKVIGSTGMGNDNDHIDQPIYFYAGASVPLSTNYFCGMFGFGTKKIEAIKLIASEEPICISPGRSFRAVLPDTAIKMACSVTDAITLEVKESAHWRARNRQKDRKNSWKLPVSFANQDENMDDNTSVLEVIVDVPIDILPSYKGDTVEVTHEMILGVQNEVSGLVAITNKIPLHVVALD